MLSWVEHKKFWAQAQMPQRRMKKQKQENAEFFWLHLNETRSQPHWRPSLTHCCREALKRVHRQTVQTQIRRHFINPIALRMVWMS